MMNWNKRYASRPKGPILYKHDDENFNPDDPRHGDYGYRMGCRCGVCKQFKSDEDKQHREKKLKELINNPDDPRHGTPGGGKVGCPCEPCQTAKINSRLNTQTKILSILKADPDHPLHGTLGGYNHGCRCDGCKDAMNTYKREYYRDLIGEA